MVEHLDERVAAMTVSEAWASYVEVADVDPVTLRSYQSRFARHVGPALGDRPVAGLTRDDVVLLLAGLRALDLGSGVARQCKVVLSLLCRRAVELGVADHVPTVGVRVPAPPAPLTRVMAPDDFLRVRAELPTAGARLLADVLVRSGLRLGEALALSPQDVDDDGLLVRRSLSEPGRRLSADGQRFALRPTTKTGTARRVVVGRPLADRLREWSAANGVDPSGLVFPAALVLPAPSGRSFPRSLHRSPLTPERLAELGPFTGPNGRQYQHGTVNGYVTGRCREACCRQAISEYSAARRRERRGRGRDAAPVPAPVVGSGAVRPADGAAPQPQDVLSPQSWSSVWGTAVEAAALGFQPLARQTRHAHASWLNGSGVGVERIADRLGHRDERSTRGYVRPVGPEPDVVTVLDALLGGGGPPQERPTASGL